MKRSEIIKKMLIILESWESCKLEEPCADELLTLLETEGMYPPSYFGNKGDYGLILKQGWEPEGIDSKKQTK